ncbi:uncharacterized protein LOC108668922 [Hyalella azteca]|uniref:Uncharacterized protein LOC108668922 n=1 Tax=Hyalella azteca TaxID=294128 RepID=A0A8B7NDV4_HYAAZ|nr:uncharacterized protein LOC108668922 [Hyalella azteca]
MSIKVISMFAAVLLPLLCTSSAKKVFINTGPIKNVFKTDDEFPSIKNAFNTIFTKHGASPTQSSGLSSNINTQLPGISSATNDSTRTRRTAIDMDIIAMIVRMVMLIIEILIRITLKSFGIRLPDGFDLSNALRQPLQFLEGLI